MVSPPDKPTFHGGLIVFVAANLAQAYPSRCSGCARFAHGRGIPAQPANSLHAASLRSPLLIPRVLLIVPTLQPPSDQ
ncbi:hypothetical protein R84865_000647 [Carnimonas sp. R-84865]